MKKQFPNKWGNPPELQTGDIRELPYGYGFGSSTLAGWIRENFFRSFFPEVIRDAAWKAMTNAHNTGFEKKDDATALLLMHAEISEAVEALRDGNPESKKIPGYSCVEEELADVVIRIMNYCADSNYDLGNAILEKMKYNETREYKHGGKKF